MRRQLKLSKEVDKMEEVLRRKGVTDAIIIVGIGDEEYVAKRLSNPGTAHTGLAKFISDIWWNLMCDENTEKMEEP